MTNLDINEGNDKIWVVTFKDDSGDAIDLTGYEFLFTVKSDVNDSDDDAIISKNITTAFDPTNGITKIILERADTLNISGNYVYDYQWCDTADDRRTILSGTFTIKQSIGDRDC